MATGAVYNLLSILWWNLVGQYMYYVYGLNLTAYWRRKFLSRFDHGPPQWWRDTWVLSRFWNDNLYDCAEYNRKCIPNINFVLLYRSAAKDRYSDWVAKAADNVARPLFDYVGALLGSLLHGYTTFSNWIESIRNIVGTYVPWWTTTLASGLVWLRLKFPTAIRDATSTWDAIWESIKTAVKDWAKTRFDTVKNWLANTWPGLKTAYDTVKAWYDLVGSWVTAFKNSPYATVVGWLGAAWVAWTSIRSGITDFYNNVWVPFKVGLHDFLDHPVLWLEDRVEEEVAQHLATFTIWVGPIFERVFLWWVDHG